VSHEGEEVDVEGGHVERHLADALRSVRVDEHARRRLLDRVGDLLDWLDRSDLKR
jgi:hypothetical protein